MNLTVLDIKKKEFRKVMRGFDPADVREFLEEMAAEWDQLNTRNRDLQTRVVELETQVRDFRQVEQVLQQALKKTEETSRQQMELIRQQAEATLRESDLKAARLVDSARNEANEVRQQIVFLEQTRTDLLNRLDGILTTFRKNVDDFRSELRETAPRVPVNPPVQVPAVPDVPAPTVPSAQTPQIPETPPAPRKINLDHLLNTLD
ncbi:MAG: DivIVA domain-containing protein [Bacteroidetes bacterium]|nr:DivIVA domain-containing protein [Bacteroidota bacterium]